MQNIFDECSTAYNGIAKYYELWSQGDNAYKESLEFYVKTLSMLPSPMLELGIGTGRIAHSLLLADSSIKLTGIDNSAEMLKICAERCKIFDSRLQLLLMDMCSSEFNFDNDFNTIYLPFRTIGHIPV